MQGDRGQLVGNGNVGLHAGTGCLDLSIHRALNFAAAPGICTGCGPLVCDAPGTETARVPSTLPSCKNPCAGSAAVRADGMLSRFIV